MIKGIIENWLFVDLEGGNQCVIGSFNGEAIRTSVVRYYDKGQKIVHTWSGSIYQLGQPNL